MSWDGADYQARMDAALAEARAAGHDPHGEAAFVERFAPEAVLDAGCGTGRVAIELERRGVAVTGVDVDASMLATARSLAPHLDWVEADLCHFDLGRTFPVVVMAGNVPLFTPPGTQRALVEHVAAHVAPGGVLIAGFSTSWSGREYPAAEYDRDLAAAGHAVAARFATWEGDPWTEAADYVVTVSRPDAAP